MENRIYILNTDQLYNTELFEYWYAKMPQERKKKIDSFCFQKDKCLSLGAGIILYKGLLNAGAAYSELSYGKNGKPFLTGQNDIYFNLSHSEKMAAGIFSDRTVGIDLEKERHFDDDLINYVYLKSEIEYIQNSHEKQDIAFTKLWTIKESIMKYFGTGLSLEPKKICIDMQNGIHAFCENFLCNNIYFTQYTVNGYYITVCSEYDKLSCKPESVVL